MSDVDADLYARSLSYIRNTATPRDNLAAASGVSERDLAAIDAAGALPAPTYVVFENAVRSPIRVLGNAPSEGGRAFYCPAVLSWVRRAALMRPADGGLLERLQDWFSASFRQALRTRSDDARHYAWARLLGEDAALDEAALAQELRSLNADWLQGGWAVCLRRWNGDHVVAKEIERARIGELTDDGRRALSPGQRLELFDAIERLENVMLPFAPYERPHGTPGLFIDRMRRRYGV